MTAIASKTRIEASPSPSSNGIAHWKSCSKRLDLGGLIHRPGYPIGAGPTREFNFQATKWAAYQQRRTRRSLFPRIFASYWSLGEKLARLSSWRHPSRANVDP